MEVVILILIAIGSFSLSILLRKKKKTNSRAIKFEVMRVSGLIMQFFESYDIIYSTLNLQTLESRVRFVDNFYNQLITLHTEDYYQSAINNAILNYKKLYPNRYLKKLQLSLIQNPDITQLKEFYARCVVVSFSGYADKQLNEIQELKRQHAINKRREQVIEVGDQAKYLFKILELDTSGIHLDEIEKIRELFYNTREA